MKTTSLKETCRTVYEKAAGKVVEGLADLLLPADDDEGLAAITSEILEGQCQDAMPLSERVDSKDVSKALETA